MTDEEAIINIKENLDEVMNAFQILNQSLNASLQRVRNDLTRLEESNQLAIKCYKQEKEGLIENNKFTVEVTDIRNIDTKYGTSNLIKSVDTTTQEQIDFFIKKVNFEEGDVIEVVGKDKEFNVQYGSFTLKNARVIKVIEK